MSTLSSGTIEVKCPWDGCQGSWWARMPELYKDAEAIPDPLEGMPGYRENCHKCGHIVFIHFLKKGERRIQSPQKGHRSSPP